MKTFAIAALAALVMSAPAAAATWTFSYSSGAGVLSGTLDGVLQGDNNTIVVGSVSNATFNGTPGVALGFFSSVSNYLVGSGAPPSVTIDGSAMDFVGCDSGTCFDGLYFITDPSFFGVPIFASGLTYSNSTEGYDAAGWSIRSAVPEPASWAMLIAGFGLTGAAMRRRRVALAA